MSNFASAAFVARHAGFKLKLRPAHGARAGFTASQLLLLADAPRTETGTPGQTIQDERRHTSRVWCLEPCDRTASAAKLRRRQLGQLHCSAASSEHSSDQRPASPSEIHGAAGPCSMCTLRMHTQLRHLPRWTKRHIPFVFNLNGSCEGGHPSGRALYVSHTAASGRCMAGGCHPAWTTRSWLREASQQPRDSALQREGIAQRRR